MLNKTSELAMRSVLLLGLEQEREPMSPRVLAERLECSVSYLSKTLALLTRAGILESVRGARGGVLLRKDASEITLQHIVVACQGVLVGNHCRWTSAPDVTCGYHAAMMDIFGATMAALGRWSLADMMVIPVQPGLEGVSACKMYFQGCERHCTNTRIETKGKDTE